MSPVVATGWLEGRWDGSRDAGGTWFLHHVRVNLVLIRIT